jgi:hypothetical protein
MEAVRSVPVLLGASAVIVSTHTTFTTRHRMTEVSLGLALWGFHCHLPIVFPSSEELPWSQTLGRV